jgi:hypothetical protein
MKTKSLRQYLIVLAFPLLVLWHIMGWFNELQHKERARLLGELSQTRGFMQLLMKQRNGYHWTPEDRQAIRAQLRIIWGVSPYVVLLLAPGGMVALPLLAWWLDRRNGQRTAAVRVR